MRGRPEAQALRGLDLQRLAGARIAAHARRTLRDAERAEGADLHLAAALDVLETCLQRVEHDLDRTLGISLAHLAGTRDRFHEIRLAHGIFSCPVPTRIVMRFASHALQEEMHARLTRRLRDAAVRCAAGGARSA